MHFASVRLPVSSVTRTPFGQRQSLTVQLLITRINCADKKRGRSYMNGCERRKRRAFSCCWNQNIKTALTVLECLTLKAALCRKSRENGMYGLNWTNPPNPPLARGSQCLKALSWVKIVSFPWLRKMDLKRFPISALERWTVTNSKDFGSMIYVWERSRNDAHSEIQL